MNPRAASKERWTEAEYLEMERASETKHEYYDGRVYAMAGASRAHSRIAGNIAARLNDAFGPRACEALQSDMRVRIDSVGLCTYPDVVAVCGGKYLDGRTDTLLNPLVVVEVLSDSTESYDRGTKFEWYRSVTSITDVLLVAQKKPLVEQYTRQPDGAWLLREHRASSRMVLASLNCELSVDDIYLKVDFEMATPESTEEAAITPASPPLLNR